MKSSSAPDPNGTAYLAKAAPDKGRLDLKLYSKWFRHALDLRLGRRARKPLAGRCSLLPILR